MGCGCGGGGRRRRSGPSSPRRNIRRIQAATNNNAGSNPQLQSLQTRAMQVKAQAQPKIQAQSSQPQMQQVDRRERLRILQERKNKAAIVRRKLGR